MNRRILLAMLLSPLAAAATYVVAVITTLGSVPPDQRPGEFSLLVPSVIVCVVFEVFILLPGLLWIRPLPRIGGVLFFVGSTAIWLIGSHALLSATDMTLSAIVATSAQLLLPGLVLIGVFGFLTRNNADA